jgi:hypothetical protein
MNLLLVGGGLALAYLVFGKTTPPAFAPGPKVVRVDYSPGTHNVALNVGDTLQIAWPILPGQDQIDGVPEDSSFFGEHHVTGSAHGPGSMSAPVVKSGTTSLTVITGNFGAKTTTGQMILNLRVT